jgi:hypothetical protein
MSRRLHTRAKLCWFAAYFGAVATFISGMVGPLPLADHQWPLASASIESFRQHSRIIQTTDSTRFSYRVYWMEFRVILDLPVSQCPRPMQIGANASGECVGLYRTIEAKSASDNWQWGSRHPIHTKVQVHYDPKGGLGNQVFFAGEGFHRVYPWTGIWGVFVMGILTGIMFVVAAGQARRADRLEPQSSSDAT